MDNAFHKARNELTQYNNDFRQISPSLMCLYNALPQKYVQEIYAIFLGVMQDKYYKETNKPNEDKRIYNYVKFNPEDLLKSLHPDKYIIETDLKDDIGNLLKKLRILSKNNVCYFFNCGGSYLFFMEREFGSWKFFNTEGCLVPKTLKKILAISDDFMQRLLVFERNEGRIVNIKTIEIKTAKFLNQLISQMHFDISPKLPKWKKGIDARQYIDDLKIKVKHMDDFLGLEHASDFLQKLPPFVKNKLEKKIMKIIESSKKNMKKEKISDTDLAELESSIIPAENGLVKKRHTRNKKKNNILVDKIEIDKAEIDNWKDTKIADPFSTERAFIDHYKIFIRYYSNQYLRSLTPNFNSYKTELRYASEILDILLDHNRKNHLFLERWLLYFCKHHLRSAKVCNKQKTSLSALKVTFKEFNNIYYTV